MNRLAVAILLISSLSLQAQMSLRSVGYSAGVFKRTSGGAGPSYLVTEGFEGTGAPSGWGVIGTGPVDWDESTVVGAGSQSLELDGTTADSTVTNTFTAQSQCWGYFMFYPTNYPSTDCLLFRIYTNGVVMGQIEHRSSGVLRVQAGTGVSTPASCTLATSSNAWRHVWWRYQAGSGSDGAMEVWWNTSATHPGSSDGQYHALCSNGTNTALVHNFRIWSDFVGSINGLRYYDNVRVDDEAIGSNP